MGDDGDAADGGTAGQNGYRRVREVDDIEVSYSRGGSCGRVFSLNTRERSTPTPSNTPRRIPQAIADPKADFGPPMRD